MVIRKFCELFQKSITQEFNLVTFRVLTSLVQVEGVREQKMTELQTLFKEHCVVPDVINISPSELLTIKYPSGSVVTTGKELTPTQVKDQPVVQWAAKEDEYYTLAMVDPDAPSREEPKFREWHHWLVGNILGGHIGKGEILSEYIGSGPPKGTGLHRYVFLVYKQPEKCDFSKITKLRNNSGEKRGKFSIAKFATQFKFGSPIAGNFYVAKYDDYVPKLYAKLKG
ncbi:protein D2-like [Spodoptera litura]|uniref:Protein D2-like n=1 Tax=Spodoptera litura TaxID=69820 RepID=A0A9J7ILA9_SPOLT|nr:protein D2-like [Spodoptera litura]